MSVVLTDRELEEMAGGPDGVIATEIPLPPLSIFWTRGVVWETHTAPDESKCVSRVMRLFMPWRYDMIPCQHEPEPSKDDPDWKQGKVGHCVTHYDPVAYSYCMDCRQVGVHRSREQYENADKPCEFIPTNGNCKTHRLGPGECARVGVGP